ncbi:hypothetical protein [Methanocella sp. MCL-LM]|uniref:hypothetical protein n=1 Tax=Methanocella sp. MCL-LM TaxID=3412035 RepID=UPI003C789E2B
MTGVGVIIGVDVAGAAVADGITVAFEVAVWTGVGVLSCHPDPGIAQHMHPLVASAGIKSKRHTVIVGTIALFLIDIPPIDYMSEVEDTGL